LGAAPQATGGNGGTGREIAPAKRVAADQRVARVFPGAHGSDGESLWQLGRKVFQRVNGEVYPAIEQCIIDLLRKECLAPDSSERNMRSEIARRLDLDPLGSLSGGREQRAYSLCLP
jgi:hypothetical protein